MPASTNSRPTPSNLFSWGGPGTAPGQFNLPHGVWIDRRGRVLVADRENDRVQVFDQNGELLEVWSTELIGPAFFYVDDDDVVYFPEHDGGRISILTLGGERLARWGDPVHRSCGEWGRVRRVVKYEGIQVVRSTTERNRAAERAYADRGLASDAKKGHQASGDRLHRVAKF